jgi:hypothetical protein
MGRKSSSKKVARVAATGGGRTVGRRRPYGWYSMLFVLVALGVFLIAFSRHERQAAAAIHPRGADHWHDAYAIDICGVIQPNLAQNPNLSSTPAPGIHTHGDGLIHIEPYVSNLATDAGTHASVARFAKDYPGFVLTSTKIQLPGGKLYRNGDKCDGKAAQIRIRMWPNATQSASITYTNPDDVKLNNGGAITIAFLPASADIPKPPQTNIDHLTNPSAAEPGQSTSQTAVTVAPTPASTPPASTAPAAPASTAPAAPATTSPASTAPASTAPASTAPPTTTH